MSESTVSSPFMKFLRLVLPGAQVIKHRDASMIGLLDCSVTFNRKIAWIEFKLWKPPIKWNGFDVPYIKIAEESPTQYEMAKRLSEQATFAAYIIWVNKTRRILVWHLTDQSIHYFKRTPEVVDYIASLLV